MNTIEKINAVLEKTDLTKLPTIKDHIDNPRDNNEELIKLRMETTIDEMANAVSQDMISSYKAVYNSWENVMGNDDDDEEAKASNMCKLMSDLFGYCLDKMMLKEIKTLIEANQDNTKSIETEEK